jgi:hypothetical protein
MKIDDIDGEPEFPRKLLDKKAYVAINPDDGLPQLIRVEPNIGEGGEIDFSTVLVYIDDAMALVMEREVAEVFVSQRGCVPLEEIADWKHRKQN